jgi:hypothetical protein
MAKRRIQVYTDDETKRRIEVAALIREMPVTEYCLQAIRQQLAEDDMLEGAQVQVKMRSSGSDTLIDDLRSLRERILGHCGGSVIDVDEVLEQVRSERDDELLSGVC